MSAAESAAPVSPSLEPKFRSILALQEPGAPFDAPGPHLDAFRALSPSEQGRYLNWATHLPPAAQPVSSPSPAPPPQTLAEYAARLRHLDPLDAAAAQGFAHQAQSAARPSPPFALGVRHGPDGREAGRVALRSAPCPWRVRDAQDGDPRGDAGRRDGLVRLGVEPVLQGASRAGAGRVGMYLGALVEAHGGADDAWDDTPCHLFVAADTAYSVDCDSPVLVVREAKAGGFVVSHEPAAPTVVEMARMLEEAAESSGLPVPRQLQAPLAAEEGDRVSAWVVRTRDLETLGLVGKSNDTGGDESSGKESGMWDPSQDEAKEEHHHSSLRKKVGGLFHRH